MKQGSTATNEAASSSRAAQISRSTRRINRMELEALASTIRSRLAAGEHLPAERILANELGVNRHRLRLALAMARGVDALPGATGRLLTLGPMLALDTNPLEVMEMRLTIEPMLARLAAIRATPRDIEAMRKLHREFEESGYTRTGDFDFHFAVAVASRNGLALRFLIILNDLARDKRMALPISEEVLRLETGEHRTILDAIARRDPVGADQAMTAHLAAAQSWMAGLSAKREG